MKKILLSLFGIITLGLVNFGSCQNYTIVSDLIIPISSGSVNLSTNSFQLIYTLPSSDSQGTYCVKIDSFQGVNGYFGRSNFLNEFGNAGYVVFSSAFSDPNYICFYLPSYQPYLQFRAESYAFSLDYELFKLDSVFDSSIPVMSSNDCKSTYNLVDSSDLQSCQSDLSTCYYDYGICQSDLLDCQSSSGSSCPTIDTQYCMINGLCPSVSGSGTSNIYIYSDSQYTPLNSASNIYVNLPSYVGYNHSYSNGGNDLDITVGYVIDTGYIENINNQQSYIPTTDDFSNVFGNIGTFGALLVVCLFVILVFYMIKKIFS